MVTLGRAVLWTLVLVAPGGFLLVPVLVLHGGDARSGAMRERLGDLLRRARVFVAQLQRYWTKS
jgi:hypothetical protein